MKIALVLNHFLPDHIAGTEVYAFNLGRQLQVEGHDVVVIIPNYFKTQNEVYSTEGLKVIKYAEPSVIDKNLQMGRRKPAGLSAFSKVLREENPDIVHIHELAGSNGITLHHVVCAKTAGFVTIMTFHLGRYTASTENLKIPGDIFNTKKAADNFYKAKGLSARQRGLVYKLSKMLASFDFIVALAGKAGTALTVPQLLTKRRDDFVTLLKHCDKIVTIANWYRKLLIDNGIDENTLAFIEQGINHTGSAKSTDYVRKSNNMNFIFVGRISHFKGVQPLIRAFSELSCERSQLDIFGASGEDNNYMRECETLISGQRNIRLMGKLQPSAVVQKISEYDVLILPSTFSEMSPLIIREAFAAQVPVLASDSLGAKEQIDENKNGWFFKMNDWDDLKAKLEWLIQRPEIIKRTNGFPQVRTFKEVTNEYISLYKSVL